MTEKTKIKQLLDSINPGSQKLGCSLANSILGWSNTEIWNYLLNSMGGVEIDKFSKDYVHYIKYVANKLYYWDISNGQVRLLRYPQEGGSPELKIYYFSEHKGFVDNIHELYEINLIT